MNSTKMILLAMALSTVSLSGLAAEGVDNPPTQQQEVGVVSASGSDLSTLESHLAAKADAAGAKSFRITSTSGNNRMHGTAVIYQ